VPIASVGGRSRQSRQEYQQLVAWVSPLVHESVWFTLVINGDNDVIIYSINSWILQQNIPNAQLIIYPDANYGSQ
jgi:hypothetical protein